MELDTYTAAGIVRWSDEKYSIGIAEIDEQHQCIFAYINEIAIAIENKADKFKLSVLFNQLFDYTEYHCQYEEQYFAVLSPEDLTLHKLQHKHFLEQVREIQKQSEQQLLTNIELLYCLAEWYTDHMQLEDKKLNQ